MDAVITSHGVKELPRGAGMTLGRERNPSHALFPYICLSAQSPLLLFVGFCGGYVIPVLQQVSNRKTKGRIIYPTASYSSMYMPIQYTHPNTQGRGHLAHG